MPVTSVLADTSAWIEHLRGSTDILCNILENDDYQVVTHPMVMTEIALSGITPTSEFWQELINFPSSKTTTDEETLVFINHNNIAGRGIGYVDVNLVTSCIVSNLKLVTFDKKLEKVAERHGILYK